MNTPTPGPWEVGYHSTGDRRDGALVFEVSTKLNIANLWAGLRPIEEVDANARQIAANPELLAFAHNTLAALTENGAEANLDNIIAAARAVIAKAT